jgi:SsrA-binding protein
MAKKRRTEEKRITNRRAKFDYELGDSLIVGLQLTGAETKALRLGHGSLIGSYVAVRNGELWLLNAQIMGTAGIQIAEDGQTRSRKLLAKKAEINRLIEAKKQGRTIVPLELLTTGRYIKLRIAEAQGKKRYDKRETLKRRQQERDASRAIKQ